MSLLSIILLLAACSSPTIAGPVPQHDRRLASFANTTSTVIHTPVAVLEPSTTTTSTFSIIGSESLQQTFTLPLPSSTGQRVKADTALVIEPIQKTIITRVNPPITFLNPDGKPIASQPAETILITSYFTPTPVTAASPSAVAPSSILSKPSLSPSQGSSTSQAPIPLQSSSTIASPIPASSIAAVESGPLNITSIPSFTYTPDVGLSEPPAVTEAPRVTSKAAASNATGLPGFVHPSPVSRSATAANPLLSSAAIDSASIASSKAPSSSATPAPGAPSTSTLLQGVRPSAPSNATDTRSRVVVTKTLYTTVYPSSRRATKNPVPTPPRGADPGAIFDTPAQLASSTRPPAAASPSPLAPPPVVIVTLYTTVTPSPTILPSQIPEAPNTPVVPAPSPNQSTLSASTAVSSAAASSRSPEASPSPSSLAVPSPLPSASSSTSPAARPPPRPSSKTTSDSPLIISPIAPSQIFTVTVTTTQRETVTETATGCVTVRA